MDEDWFNEEENNEADDSDNNNKIDKDYEFYNDVFDGEIDPNEETDEDDETSETENNMKEMYELYMKKVYQEYVETEDGNYKKDQIKGHLQNEAAYLNGANVMGTKILNSTEKLLAWRRHLSAQEIKMKFMKTR